jgi:mRNA interferase RelE/StbE
MKIARTDRFKKAWEKLSEEEKDLGRKALRNLAVDMRYPSLRLKKIKGSYGLWEARASQSLRMTFAVIDETIILRNIGPHDEALGKP